MAWRGGGGIDKNLATGGLGEGKYWGKLERERRRRRGWKRVGWLRARLRRSAAGGIGGKGGTARYLNGAAARVSKKGRREVFWGRAACASRTKGALLARRRPRFAAVQCERAVGPRRAERIYFGARAAHGAKAIFSEGVGGGWTWKKKHATIYI